MSSILLVDDDPDVYKVTNLVLARAGYEVAWAKDGVEAVSALASADLPDLVLLDIMMPRMDGHELLLTIRQDPRLRHLPVLMLTALREAEDMQRAREMGALGYIVKPFRAGDLLSRVGKFAKPKPTSNGANRAANVQASR